MSRVRRAGNVVYEATFGAVRDLVWPDLRDGVIRIRDLSPAHSALVVVASALMVGSIGVLVAAPSLRAQFDLVARTRGEPGRGALVPTPLAPMVLWVLAISSGLLLAGALHVHRVARVAVLAGYLAFALAAQSLAFPDLGRSGWPGWGATAAVLAVGVVFVARSRSEERPVLEALLLISLTTAHLAIVQQELLRLDRLSGTSFLVDQTQTLTFVLAGIVTPILLVAGLDVFEFAATASGWTLRFVEDRVHRRVVIGGLVVLVVWRARDLVADLGTGWREDARGVLWAHLGAVVLVALVAGSWWTVDRLADRADGGQESSDGDIAGSAQHVGLPVAFAYQALVVLSVLAVLVTLVTGADVGFTEAVADFVHGLNQGMWLTWWRWAVDVGVVVVGLLLARRGLRAMALVLVVVGATDLLAQATDSGRWLHRVAWDEAAVDHVWFLVMAGAAAWWIGSRTLSSGRVERLFFLVVLAAIIRQSTFISDPFAIVLGFAGAGFVAFGLLWGFLTAGAWANKSTPRWPRSSRVFMFLGYSLFSIALLDWFVVTHDIDQTHSITDLTPSFGQSLLGYPMLWALFAVTLAGAVKHRSIELDDEA